jgi:hypothetical protein
MKFLNKNKIVVIDVNGEKFVIRYVLAYEYNDSMLAHIEFDKCILC